MKYNEEELKHYGVLGMRWGVHRSRNKRGSSISKKTAKKRTSSADAPSTFSSRRHQKKVAKQRAKNLEKARQTRAANKKIAEEHAVKIKKGKLSPKEMSDKELASAISRLEMEQRYSQLSPKQVSVGKSAAKAVFGQVIAPAAVDIGKQLVKSGMAYGVNRVFDLDNKQDFKVYANNKRK